jgi:hypothetical protein
MPFVIWHFVCSSKLFDCFLVISQTSAAVGDDKLTFALFSAYKLPKKCSPSRDDVDLSDLPASSSRKSIFHRFVGSRRRRLDFIKPEFRLR